MKVLGIIGMGKMGQAVVDVLSSRLSADFNTFPHLSEADQPLLKQCTAVIEFTTPEAAPGIIRHCIESGIPVVSGTTGWHQQHLNDIISLCQDRDARFLYATNFSIGMNITFAINRQLASLMQRFPQFEPGIKEIHHIHKKDAPSGTALTLIEDLLSQHPDITGYDLNNEATSTERNKLKVTAIREGEVKGYHEVIWDSGLEKIKLSHEAFDRKIFAEGAILAANWLDEQSPGVYTMRDVIQIRG